MPASSRYIGIMTGTSMDGIDAAAVDFGKQLLPAAETIHVPMPDSVRSCLADLQQPGSDELARAAQVSLELAECYAAATDAAIAKAGWQKRDVAAIGLHGQTVRHHPADGWTIQLANGAALAERAGIDVVCDFRSGDIVRGGQGAPLAPAFHRLAFAAEHSRRILNLGGIANITVLGPHAAAERAYDTGPGCMLLDAMAVRHLQQDFDDRGKWAAGANANAQLLDQLASHPFFAASAPKSCGRQDFPISWVDELAGSADPQTVQATLLELTAQTAATAARQQADKDTDLIVCGGGAHNDALIARIGELADMPTKTCGDLGCEPQWVEPAAFAYFASLRMRGEKLEIAWATGAAADGLAGAVYSARR